MEQTQDRPATGEPKPVERISFDEHVAQLPASRQSAHRWVVLPVAAAFLLTLGVFVYALYASFSWQAVGEANVVLAWLYFFLASGLAVALLGADTLIVGATVPPPFAQAQYSFETGRSAVRSGWSWVAMGALVMILAVVGVLAVRAGQFGLEQWITLVAGFWAIVGLAAAAYAILKWILRRR